jgi:hypothetical protein
MKKKMGRPKLPKGEAKKELFAVKLSKLEAEKVYAAIDRSGVPYPDWLRGALLTAAER